jgi:sporulation protein YabP
MDKVQSEYKSVLLGRELLQLAGVVEVDGFDDHQVTADSILGPVMVQGRNLKITQLDVEAQTLTVEGQIISLSYLEAKRKKSGGGRRFLKRLIG